MRKPKLKPKLRRKNANANSPLNKLRQPNKIKSARLTTNVASNSNKKKKSASALNMSEWRTSACVKSRSKRREDSSR